MDDVTIDVLDIAGVNMAAIKAIIEEIEIIKEDIEILKNK